MNEDVLQTEFNSNLACLIRIDELMKTLHRSAMGVIPELNNKFLYCVSLLRLYKEGKSKFNKEEKETCNKYVSALHSVGIYPTMNGIRIYPETIQRANEFEDYLIDCLDRHNMLMANKQEIDETPDNEWF